MIILFHWLSVIMYQLLRNRERIKCIEKSKEKLNEKSKEKLSEKSKEKLSENIVKDQPSKVNSSVNVDVETRYKFDPPVYLQRYDKVFLTLREGKLRTEVSSLADFGCSNTALFKYIKNLHRLEHMYFIDIDEDVLTKNAMRIDPFITDFMTFRPTPLEVTIMQGSVADPDYRIKHVDVVTAIELIEHLYPDVLDAFAYNIFGYIEPKVVIITTPNADLNVIFSMGPNKFRHYDHKFEWSREVFEDWANHITARFKKYDVSFDGIGDGPKGTKHLGKCSQMALFVRKDVGDHGALQEWDKPCTCYNWDSPCFVVRSGLACNCLCKLCSPCGSYGVCTYYTRSKKTISLECTGKWPLVNYYKFIKKVEYPFTRDNRTEDERLKYDFEFKLKYLGRAWGRFYVRERNRAEVPLEDLIYVPPQTYITEPEAKKLLQKFGYEVTPCFIPETGSLKQSVIYEPVMEESSSDGTDYDYVYRSGEPPAVVFFDPNKETDPEPENTDLQEDTEKPEDNILEDYEENWDDTYDNNKDSEKPEEEPLENYEGLIDVQNSFPHWLLHILGSQVIGEGETPTGSQEEAHFYCQGDGLGVHPSVIAVEIDEEEDTTESSNNTADTADLDLDPSTQDMNSLPEDSQVVPLESQVPPLDSHEPTLQFYEPTLEFHGPPLESQAPSLESYVAPLELQAASLENHAEEESLVPTALDHSEQSESNSNTDVGPN